MLIESQNLLVDSFIYRQVTQLRSDYAHCLTLNNSFKKAKPEIEKAILLYENHPDYQGYDLLEVKYYEILIFDRAVVNYYTNNYKAAIEDLRMLTNRFPDDERYKNWLTTL